MLCGAGFVLFAALGAAVLIFDWSGAASTDGVVAIITLAFAAVAWWCLRFGRSPERYAVEVTDAGIRVGSGEVNVPRNADLEVGEPAGRRPAFHFSTASRRATK